MLFPLSPPSAPQLKTQRAPHNWACLITREGLGCKKKAFAPSALPSPLQLPPASQAIRRAVQPNESPRPSRGPRLSWHHYQWVVGRGGTRPVPASPVKAACVSQDSARAREDGRDGQVWALGRAARRQESQVLGAWASEDARRFPSLRRRRSALPRDPVSERAEPCASPGDCPKSALWKKRNTCLSWWQRKIAWIHLLCMHRAFWRKVGLAPTNRRLRISLVACLGEWSWGGTPVSFLETVPLKMLASDLGRTEPVLGAGSNASLRLNLRKTKATRSRGSDDVTC